MSYDLPRPLESYPQAKQEMLAALHALEHALANLKNVVGETAVVREIDAAIDDVTVKYFAETHALDAARDAERLGGLMTLKHVKHVAIYWTRFRATENPA